MSERNRGLPRRAAADAPLDWAGHYETGHTPWDLGEAHPELAARLARGELAPPRRGARALVPGCGRGYDAHWLALAGWRVTALDTVAALAERLGALLGPLGGEVAIGDALGYRSARPFDLVWDHTFFCALDPAERPAFGRMVRRVLAPGGRVASLVFPVDRPHAEGGPPWGMRADDFRRALGRGFRLIEDAPVRRAAPGRRWPERWSLLARR